MLGPEKEQCGPPLINVPSNRPSTVFDGTSRAHDVTGRAEPLPSRLPVAGFGMADDAAVFDNRPRHRVAQLPLQSFQSLRYRAHVQYWMQRALVALALLDTSTVSVCNAMTGIELEAAWFHPSESIHLRPRLWFRRG